MHRGRALLLLSGAFVLTACAPSASSRSPGGLLAYSAAALVNDLLAAGLKVQDVGEIEQPFFTQKARVFRVNADDLQVYEYPDGAAAEKDAALVSPDGGSIGTSMVSWLAPPHFYRKDRVLAIYLGADRDVLNALSRSMGAQFAGR